MTELTPDPIETRADLIKLLKAFGGDGCPGRVLRAAGVATPTAAAAELRRAGHEVEVVGHGGGVRLVYLAGPGPGARRRKKDWLPLFDAPDPVRGPYNE